MPSGRQQLAFTFVAVLGLGTTTADARAANRAQVYAENPTRTPALQLLPLATPPTTNAPLANAHFQVRSCIDGDAAVDLSAFGLGPRVPTCALEGRAKADPSGDITFPPRALLVPRGEVDAFAETSAYYHVGRTLEFFRALLPPDEPVLVEPLEVIVSGLVSGAVTGAGGDALGPFSNAFYVARTDPKGAFLRRYVGLDGNFVWFGQSSTVNFAYDGDLVAHETAHAVLNPDRRLGGVRHTSWGMANDPEALNEGLADYFAAIQTDNGAIAEFASRVLGPGAVRSLDFPPGDGWLTGDPYAQGLGYAGALRRVRQGVGSMERMRAFDASIVHTLRSDRLRPDPSFEEFILLLKDELAATGHGDLGRALDAELAAGPVAAPTGVVAVGVATPFTSSTGGFFVPGRRRARADGDLAPGFFQLRVALPEGASTLRGGVRVLPWTAFDWGAQRGKASAPLLLVSWDGPILWEEGALKSAVERVDAATVFELPIPPGTREVHVQLSNGGDEDGAVGEIGFSFPAPTANGSDGKGSTSTESAAGCAVGSTGTGSNDWILAATILAVLGRRRPSARRRNLAAQLGIHLRATKGRGRAAR